MDFYWFYFIFELLLLPIYFISYYYGESLDKVRVSYKFIGYALSTSLVWLITLTILLESSVLVLNHFWLSLGFLIPLLIKLPCPPFHIWLNDLHTASPVSGSIFLAGTILKISIYGILVYYITYFTETTYLLNELLVLIAVPNSILTALSCIRQSDYKRLIAYTSVTHMNLILYAVFVLDTLTIQGGIIFLISHGLISIALFHHVNSLYERLHTKLILYLRGITFVMPILSSLALLLHMSNFSFPPTLGWFSELLIFSYSIDHNMILAYLLAITIILGLIYSLWNYYRIYFGSISKYLINVSDITRTEYILTITIIVYIIVSTTFFVSFL